MRKRWLLFSKRQQNIQRVKIYAQRRVWVPPSLLIAVITCPYVKSFESNYLFSFSEPTLKDLENSAQIFNALSDIPGDIEDVDQLLEVSKLI